MSAFLTLTESQELTVLRSFLLSILPEGTPVVKGQVNRVAEVKQPDYVVYWPLHQPRLSTNITEFFDNIITASIAGTTLSVSSIQQAEYPLGQGTPVYAPGVLAGTAIVGQISGDPGGIGTYAVNKTQTVTSTTMYASFRDDWVPTEYVVQCDVHGPQSANNVKIIEGLFRSEYATSNFTDSGFDMQPLYADTPQQMPWYSDDQQFNDRWSIDVHMQINPRIETPQDFFAALDLGIINVDVVYPVG